jgi:hypothetical protein
MELTKGVLETICPLTLLREDGPYECCKKQCAWWQIYWVGKPEEYSECVIKSLGNLEG